MKVTNDELSAIAQEVLSFLPDNYELEHVKLRKNMSSRDFEDIYCIKLSRFLEQNEAIADAIESKKLILECLPPEYSLDYSKVVVDPNTFQYVNSVLIWKLA